jgi:hypothetical protein
VVAWPSAFPAPEIGLNAQVDYPVDAMNLDSGEIRQRPVRRLKKLVYGITFLLEGSKLAMFHAWFYYKINGGADWFDLSIPAIGNGSETKSVRFTRSGYKFTLAQGPNNFKVTAEIETLWH